MMKGLEAKSLMLHNMKQHAVIVRFFNQVCKLTGESFLKTYHVLFNH